MPDPVPVPQEIASAAPKPEKKPVSSPAKPKETPSAGQDQARLKAAHGTLEKIASGVPVSEALSPETTTAEPTASVEAAAPSTTETSAPQTEAAVQTTETTRSKDTEVSLLKEGNELLLELQDLRLWANAIATQAAETPLGSEVRADALRSLLTIESAALPPDQAARLHELQDKVKALQLPDHNPAQSATLDLLTQYNETHPDKAIPADVMAAVKSGSKDASTAASQMLQSNPDLANMTWKELTGIEGFTATTPQPRRMLELAGIAVTDETMQKAEAMFGIAKQMKEPIPWGQNIIMGVMYGSLALQFFSSVALGETSGGGH